MQDIKRMDHSQMEDKLTIAYRMGCNETMKAAERAMKRERGERDKSWQQAVETSLENLKGIGEKRKELFMEYLKENLKKAGICIK